MVCFAGRLFFCRIDRNWAWYFQVCRHSEFLEHDDLFRKWLLVEQMSLTGCGYFLIATAGATTKLLASSIRQSAKSVFLILSFSLIKIWPLSLE
jgi:hypothetical protein